MIDTAYGLEPTPSPVSFRRQGDFQLWRARDNFKPSHQTDGPERATLAFKPRSKVDDLQDGAIFRLHTRAQDSGVPVIGLRTLGQALHPHTE